MLQLSEGVAQKLRVFLAGKVNNAHVSRTPSKTSPSSFPEYGVRRELISSYFDPPLARSTFHDLVNKGQIVPMKGLRGFYRLNDSLRRLGLREVPNLPESTNRSGEDLVRLAFTLIDPDLFPSPPWLLFENAIDQTLVDHVLRIAEKHRDPITSLDGVVAKLAHFGGALECQAMIDRGITELPED